MFLIKAFAIDIVIYLVTRSRIGVANDAKDIRNQKEVLDQQMAALEDWRATENRRPRLGVRKLAKLTSKDHNFGSRVKEMPHRRRIYR